MKQYERKPFKKLVLLVLTLVLTMTVFSAVAWAAPRMSKTKLTLLKGQTYTLKVKKAEGTVNWSSKKKTIATVKNGKVKAKKKGTVYIIAKVDGARLKCKVTVEDPKLSKKKATLDTGKTLALKLSGTKQKITWKSANTKVATVTSKGVVKAVAPGTAKITATVLKKKFTCTVTVNKGQESSQGTTTPTEETPGTEAPAGDTPAQTPAASGFDFTKDCKVTYGEKTIHIEFKINKNTTSEDELKELGYTVNDGTASLDAKCETATYVFTKLPQTLAEIKTIPLTTKFGPVAASICAVAASDDKYYNITYQYSHPLFEAMDYLNGPKLEINNVAKSDIFLSMRETLKYGKMAYFEGAKPTNAYTPTQPYTFTLVHGPYYISAKASTIAHPEGEPARHMILISFEGDEAQRYVDVYSSSDGNWYTWDKSWQHLVASMKPVSTGSW